MIELHRPVGDRPHLLVDAAGLDALRREGVRAVHRVATGFDRLVGLDVFRSDTGGCPCDTPAATDSAG